MFKKLLFSFWIVSLLVLNGCGSSGSSDTTISTEPTLSELTPSEFRENT